MNLQRTVYTPNYELTTPKCTENKQTTSKKNKEKGQTNVDNVVMKSRLEQNTQTHKGEKFGTTLCRACESRLTILSVDTRLIASLGALLSLSLSVSFAPSYIPLKPLRAYLLALTLSYIYPHSYITLKRDTLIAVGKPFFKTTARIAAE